MRIPPTTLHYIFTLISTNSYFNNVLIVDDDSWLRDNDNLQYPNIDDISCGGTYHLPGNHSIRSTTNQTIGIMHVLLN